MREINICPSTLKPGFSTYSPEALRNLFDGRKVSHIFCGPLPNSETREGQEVMRGIGRISLSGAQQKFSVVLGEDDKLRYRQGDEKGQFILKPRPSGTHIINKDFCAANEHLTMQMAKQVYDIETASNALCFYAEDNSMAYLTRRFDIVGQEKYPQEDFAALMGYTKDFHGSEYKYHMGSYEECGEIIKKYVKAALPDLRRFFKLILFNFLTLNDDAHLKNFSLIERDGEYHLAPAYDLINTHLQLWEPRIFALDKGLFKEGMKLSDTRWVTRQDFYEFGKRLGLPERIIVREMERFLSPHSTAKQLIERSFLSDDLKKRYWESFEYRRKMLTF